MKIKLDAVPIATSDFFYDLFDGGYIDPDDVLEIEDAERVNEAVQLILEFREILEDNDMIEYS